MFRTRQEKWIFKIAGFLFWIAVCNPVASQTVNVWLTTDDQTRLLQPQTSVAFSTGAGGTNPVVLDESQTYQQIEGFDVQRFVRL